MLLSVKDLDVKYGRISALKNISFDVESNQLTTLLGANGAGKSTLLNTISGLLKPAKGNISFSGENILGFPPEKIVKAGISQCPEGRRVFYQQTVYENMRIGAFTRMGKSVESEIQSYFERFPRLGERKNQPAGLLSGGEQQMLVICRALMSRPKLILLDEPSMGLAPKVVSDIFSLIKEIAEQGTNVLLVEQNAKQALKISDKCYVMEVGRIVAEGKSSDMLKSEKIRKAFLGE